MKEKILIIEDDQALRQLLERFLASNGFSTEVASNGLAGIAAFQKNPANIVVCDFKLGDLEATDVLQKIKEIDPQVPFIIITGYSDIRNAINVIKLGALDYLTKPLIPEELLQIIKRALQHEVDDRMGKNEKTSKKTNNNSSASNGSNIFSNSNHSKELLRQIDLVAPTNYSVIIYGESGVGKEAVAQTIHKRSNRSNAPFVALDCGAMSKELAGSELFGHEKGAFTGALATKIGQFELANGGTLFLDEIANLSYDIQSSLLRVIQERKAKRIGGTKEIPFDVRIIAASNENLVECCKKGKFREDLFHRFNEFQLTIEPLRKRKEDILFYAQYFLKNANKELDKNIEGFDEEVENLFVNYSWYGNLREMKNIIRRSALLSDGRNVSANTLPVDFSNEVQSSMTENTINTSETISTISPEKKEKKTNLKAIALEAEYAMIIEVLKQVNYNKSKAAKILNVNRKTLYNKMKSYDIEDQEITE
jgi:two-component system response regulator HydG